MTAIDEQQAGLCEELAAALAERDMTMRAVWAAIERRLEFTLDWLEMITGSAAEDLTEYLSLLARHGYVEICGIRRAASGEVVPMFRQRIRHGSRPPYWDDDQERLVDPNRPAPSSTVTRQSLPTMTARLRYAGEMLGRFTRRELEEAVLGRVKGPDAERFMFAWKSLVARKGMVRGRDGRYEAVQDPEINRMREFLRSNRDRQVTGRDVWQALGNEPIPGRRIREAVELIAAEGFRVRLEGPGTGGNRIYVIEKG
ncbi:MAG: hypothetical protein AB1646_25750 [Thermodesulfobacteriota bacterium]